MKVNNLAWTRRYFEWLYRHRKALNFGAALLTAGCIYLTSKLEIRSSFSELLPTDLPSVVHLNAAMERLGGTGFLLVGVESPSFTANKKFVEALAKRLENELPPEDIRYIEYRYKEARDYLEKFGLHYLSDAQLQKLRDRIEGEIDKKKDNALAGFLGLDDDSQKKIVKEVDFKEMLSRELDPRIRRFAQFPDAYVGTDDGKLLVIRILPTGSSLSVSSAHKLTNAVQKMINELDPKSYNPAMKVGFAGSVQRSIEEFSTIRHDIADTSMELVVLIVLVLFLFFWNVRWIFLLISNLALGTAWTFGFTKLVIGYLNTQTGFLGSLVVGTGINYGVIFLARYLEERRKGVDIKDAVVTGISSTTTTTLLASGATAVSFASLLVADNKGLSQFGFIGCIGILFCWLSAYLLLPLWVYQWESRWPQRSYRHPIADLIKKKVEQAGKIMIRMTPMLSVIMVLVSVLGIYGFRKLAHDPLEYNFSKLQNRISIKEGGSSLLNARIQSDVFKGNLSLSVILLESPDEAQELCQEVRKVVSATPVDERVFESCSTLWEFVPTKPASKEAAARSNKLRLEIKELLNSRLLNLSDGNIIELVKRLRQNMSIDPPQLEDLPHQLTRRFEERDGTIGLVGFITPASDRPLEDARNLFNYTKSFKKIILPQSGSVVTAAGDAWVLADLLKSIQTDGPHISILAFGAVIILTFLLSRSWRGGLLMACCLLAATWWQLCFQGMVGIKFNFFNFIALPITFGIGIDYPINIYLRARENAFRNFGHILATSGSAVIVCSATTILGYYTLLGASNQALVSFAELAIIGEFSCLASALIFLPVALRLLGKFRQDWV